MTVELTRLREILSQIENPLDLAAGFFAFAPVGLQIYDKHGHSVLTNAAFRELFGSEPPPEYNVLEDEIAAKQGVLDLIRRAFAGEVIEMPAVWYDPRELTQVHVTEGRRVAMESIIFPLFDGQGRVTHVAVSFRDRTAELLAQEALESEKERLREEVAIRERILAIVGHDLRSPLSAILLAAQTLARRALPEGASGAATRIAVSAGRMDRMIRDLLDVARARVGGELPLSLRRFDAAHVIAQVVDEVRAANPQRAIALEAEGPMVGKWDPDRLAQLVANLLTNAIRHGAPSAPVTVRSSAGERGLELSVHNLGPPIPAEARGRLFEPFIRGSDASEGVGLGLFIVARIATAHRGEVTVSSTESEGTTFSVRLPRND